jgi:hypothetical protein
MRRDPAGVLVAGEDPLTGQRSRCRTDASVPSGSSHALSRDDQQEQDREAKRLMLLGDAEEFARHHVPVPATKQDKTGAAVASKDCCRYAGGAVSKTA